MEQVVITHSGEVVDIKDNIECTTRSVIYLLTCTKIGCGLQYIGETGRMLFERFREHEDSVADPETVKSVGQHFQLPGHSTDDMEMIGIERVKGGLAVRKAREKFLIRKHQLISTGLNTRD